MRKRTGDQMQTPPMVSAIKKDGVPLYKLARKGQTVDVTVERGGETLTMPLTF